MTSVFVTHDQEEALEVADRIVVTNRGRIEQVGTPDQVYDNPATPFVVEFLGQVNQLPVPGATGATGYVRPHEIAVSAAPASGALPARLVHSATIGRVARFEFALEHDNRPVIVELSRDAAQALALPRGAVAHLRPIHLRTFLDT